jgi:hypothetical protein
LVSSASFNVQLESPLSNNSSSSSNNLGNIDSSVGDLDLLVQFNQLKKLTNSRRSRSPTEESILPRLLLEDELLLLNGLSN